MDEVDAIYDSLAVTALDLFRKYRCRAAVFGDVSDDSDEDLEIIMRFPRDTIS